MSSDTTYKVYWMGTRALGYHPATSLPMRIYYLRSPRKFNLANRVFNKATSENPLDDDDELTIPAVQHNVLLDWVLWRTMERVGMGDKSKPHRNQFTFGKREKKSKDQDPQTNQSGSNSQRGLPFGSKKGI